jgi:hypothetical protein
MVCISAQPDTRQREATMRSDNATTPNDHATMRSDAQQYEATLDNAKQ